MGRDVISRPFLGFFLKFVEFVDRLDGRQIGDVQFLQQSLQLAAVIE